MATEHDDIVGGGFGEKWWALLINTNKRKKGRKEGRTEGIVMARQRLDKLFTVTLYINFTCIVVLFTTHLPNGRRTFRHRARVEEKDVAKRQKQRKGNNRGREELNNLRYFCV